MRRGVARGPARGFSMLDFFWAKDGTAQRRAIARAMVERVFITGRIIIERRCGVFEVSGRGWFGFVVSHPCAEKGREDGARCFAVAKGKAKNNRSSFDSLRCGGSG